MVSIRMLLANGTVITASETENKDVFWAIRGAGHNFGIGLEATFQVYPQQNDGKELAIFVIGRKLGANGGVYLSRPKPYIL